ncbi:MAG: preprotein translocase subunit SecE [Phycisphaerales bacterium]|jgi:preprotein translocase SecE subunit|nr:preprotein translocase subunit SecE [Phycisphaerales bacterium]
MALVTRQNNEKRDADEIQSMPDSSNQGPPPEIPEEPDRDEQPDNDRPAKRSTEPKTARPQPRHGFFTLYKSGQGYWTRMCTAGGAVLVAALTAQFVYSRTVGHFPGQRGMVFGIAVGVFAALCLFSWWIINKPGNADFLIATDTEMKKVNWTSREELIGSTKVVILFMFLIAILLFVIDILFGYIFYYAGVLRAAPFH